MVATTTILVTLDGRLQMHALGRLLAAVALDMRGAGFAHGTTMRALRDRPPLLVDVLKRTIMVLAVADAMTPHAGLASPFLAVDEHRGRFSRL